MMAHPAYAQVARVQAVATNVQVMLQGLAVTLFTIAILVAGFKMAFQNAKWSEVSHIVIGGAIAGAAGGLAAWLFA
jgi:type IV secretion system protein VirB2